MDPLCLHRLDWSRMREAGLQQSDLQVYQPDTAVLLCVMSAGTRTLMLACCRPYICRPGSGWMDGDRSRRSKRVWF